MRLHKTSQENYKKHAVETHKHLIAEPYDKLYNILGYDSLTLFLKAYGGSHIYILTPKTAYKDCYTAQIKKDFDGTNYEYLAGNLDLSVRTVRTILDSLPQRRIYA